jgi:hypothetical protein
MLLAAESEGRVRVMEPPESVPPGTLTYGVGTEVPVIAYDAFATVPLVVGRVVGPDGPDAVRIDVGGREVRAQAVLAIGENVVVRLDRADAPEGEVVGFGPGLALRAAKETPPGAKVR